jgi:hypothetical protein
MKKVFCFHLVFWGFLLLMPAMLIAQAERQVIYTLQTGEFLQYGENCFSLSADKSDIFFVIKNDGKFYTIHNGVKNGPYNEMSEDKLKGCGSGPNALCARLNMDECNTDVDVQKYVATDQVGKTQIKFGGKVYGPFMTVIQFYLTCNGNGFLAVIMTDEMKYRIVTSEGKNMELPGMLEWVKLSADGKQGLIGFGMTIDPAKIDMSKINMDDFNKFSITDLNGTALGTFDRNQIHADDFWFCKSGGNHWFMDKNSGEIYRDGQPLKNLPPNYSDCDLWFSEDGKQIAVVDYGQGELVESTSIWKIKSPLQLTTYQKNGKTWIKWISLENDKELVVYNRAL